MFILGSLESSLSTDAEADQFHGFLANHLGVLLFHSAQV